MRTVWVVIMAIVLAGCSIQSVTYTGISPDAGPPGPPPPDGGDGGVAPARCAQIGYPTVPVLQTAAGPRWVASGDLDGDGTLDLVVVAGSDVLNVWLGNGDGTFRAQPEILTGSDPVSVVIVDVNHDGKPDLVSANLEVESVSVMLGQGNGRFADRVDYPVGTQPAAIAAVDLNEDGNPDLVTSSALNSTTVLFGRGDGTFAGRRDDGGNGATTSHTNLAVGDVNGDGHRDLVLVSPDRKSVV